MSDAAEAPAAEGGKKKSKLPVILVLVLLLGGGGFFAMKMKGGAKKKPAVELSEEKPMELKEFLVNLTDRGVYCRTEISLGFAKGIDAKGMEEKEAQIRDVIVMRLSSESLAEVSTTDGLKELKRMIAADLNKVLAKKEESKKDDEEKDKSEGDDASADKSDDKSTDEKTGDEKSDSKDKPSDKSDASADTAKDKDKKPSKPKHPDWDSDTGPVLKVYFNSFATQ